MVSDKIGDFLTRIRNAQMRRRSTITLPSTKQLVAISEILKKEGFIEDFSVEKSKESGNREDLTVGLKYKKGRPVIQGLKRVSKPGVRTYVGYRKIPRIYGGLGVSIITTPKGVITGETARKEKVGGELICQIW